MLSQEEVTAREQIVKDLPYHQHRGTSTAAIELSGYLFEIVKKKDFALLNSTLERWYRLGILPSIINLTDPVRETALMHACQLGQVDCVNRLLQVPGIKPNLVDAKGKTALHHAAENGNKDICESLLEPTLEESKQTDPEKFDPQLLLKPVPYFLTTPLIIAAARGHVEVVELFIAQFIALKDRFFTDISLKDFLMSKDSLNTTALDWAQALEWDQTHKLNHQQKIAITGGEKELANLACFAHRILGDQPAKGAEIYTKIKQILNDALENAKKLEGAHVQTQPMDPTSLSSALRHRHTKVEHDVRKRDYGTEKHKTNLTAELKA